MLSCAFVIGVLGCQREQRDEAPREPDDSTTPAVLQSPEPVGDEASPSSGPQGARLLAGPPSTDLSDKPDAQGDAKRVALARERLERGDLDGVMSIALDAKMTRFQRRTDGLWEFRDDALNRMFALAAFRRAKQLVASYDPSAIPGAAAPGLESETPAARLFCHALTVSPSTVEAEHKRDPIPAWAEPLLLKAKAYCVMPGGFRTRLQDSLPGVPVDESWWVARPWMTDAELLQRVSDYHDQGKFLECFALASRASGRARYQLRTGAWSLRATGLNPIAASCSFRNAVRAAQQGDLLGQETYLCWAFAVAPDLVRAGLADSRLSGDVRASLKRALMKCSTEATSATKPPFRDP